MSYLNDIGIGSAGVRCLLIFFLIFFLWHYDCYAVETVLSPSISGAFRYDDNISFSRINRERDLIFIVSPGVELSWKSDEAIIETGIRGNFSRYKHYDEFDQDHFNLNIRSSVGLSDRFSLNGSASRSRESTLDYELSETGILTQRSDVDRDNLEFGFTYMMSERYRIALKSTSIRTDYESDRYADYDGSSASVTFSRIMDSGRDTLFLRPYYSENHSSFSSVESIGVYAGWARDLRETLSFAAYAGARRSKTEYFFLTEKNRGWLADISIEKRGETWKTGIGLNRDLRFSTTGDPVETDKFYINYNKQLSERFGYAFTGGINNSKEAGSFSIRDTTYYSFNSSMRYLIREDLFLRLSYSYSVSHDSLREAVKSVDRNMLTIILDYRFQEGL